MSFIPKSVKVLSLAGTLLAFVVGIAIADNPAFEASVNTNKILLGSSAQLILTFKGSKPDHPPDIPPIDGLDVRYMGPSTNITIVNGQYSTQMAHRYALFPQKTGKFTIPSLTVQLSGQSLKSSPIDIEVIADNASVQSGQGNENSVSVADTIKDRIFITLETPRKELLLNEKIILTIKLFIKGLSISEVQYPQFDHDGFTVGEFLKPKQYDQILGGVRYDVVEFNTTISPNRVGDLKLGPVTLVCSLKVQNSNRRASAPSGFDGFFDDDFFQGFFGDYQKRPITLTSVDLPIKVIPLPDEGKPKDFSSAVGNFTFAASCSPLEVAVGDPVTLKMSVSGEGDLTSVVMPSLKAGDNFKTYDPQIKEENGKKILEQVIIPKSEKVQEIPAIQFSYFDPEKKAYQTITKGPFPLKVKKTENSDQFKIIGFDQTKVTPKDFTPEKFGEDILFIKDQPGRFRPINFRLYKSLWFILTFLFLSLSWTGLAFYHRWRRRIQTDVAYARRLLAPKKARHGMAVALKFSQEGDQKKFYDTILKILQEYFGDKLHLSSAGINIVVLERELGRLHIKANVPTDVLRKIIEKLKDIFTACDMVLFASAQFDESRMKQTYKQLEEIIDYTERNLR